MTSQFSKKAVKIDIGDGAAIPLKKDSGLFNAWWLTFFGAIGIITYLCVTQPEPYWRILTFLPDGIVVTFQVRFPDGPEGDAAREVLPVAARHSHDRLCTVGRTLQLPTSVALRIQ